jgi:hypothetical protein
MDRRSLIVQDPPDVLLTETGHHALGECNLWIVDLPGRSTGMAGGGGWILIMFLALISR